MRIVKVIGAVFLIFVISLFGGFLGSRITLPRRSSESDYKPEVPFNIREKERHYRRELRNLLLSEPIDEDSVFTVLKEYHRIRYMRDSIGLRRVIERFKRLPPPQRRKIFERIKRRRLR